MLAELERAREHFDARRYGEAVAALAKVPLRDDTDLDDVLELLALATSLRDLTKGDLRAECERQIQRAGGLSDDALRAERPCPLCGAIMAPGSFAVDDTMARFLVVGLSWESLWFHPDGEASTQPRVELAPGRGWRCEHCSAILLAGGSPRSDA